MELSFKMPIGVSAGSEVVASAGLTDGQVAFFHEHGYLAMEQPIIAPHEMDIIRSTLKRLFDGRAGWHEGAQFDLVAEKSEKDSPQSISQIFEPSNFAPELKGLRCRRTALEIARKLLGPEARPLFEHALVKPPYGSAQTPWHQDEAYLDPAFNYDHISIWIPLQDVNADNGCMQFIPGSHLRDVLPHQSLNKDPRVHALECVGDFDATLAMACPIPAGGATVHDGVTLHCSGPNGSPRPRFAYVLMFELPSSPSDRKRDFYWNVKRVPTDLQRRRAWIKSGGAFIVLLRAFKKGAFTNPNKVLINMRKALLLMVRK